MRVKIQTLMVIWGLLAVVGQLAAQEAKQDPRAKIAKDNPNVKMRGDFLRFRKRAESGKPTRVVTMGGSITEQKRGHSGQIPEWLKRRFPDADFQFTNAGISSTCSTTGAFRLESDVLSEGRVDLLIVEFAVNDDQDAAHARRECIRGMEGIVRHLRRAQPQADILMVHYVNPGMLETVISGKTPLTISAHEAVAKHYEIPTVNVAAEVAAAVKEGRYVWKDYGGTHPKPFGYQVAVNMIISALERGMEGDSKEVKDHALPLPLDRGNYGGGKFIDVQDAYWLGGWKFGKVSRELLPVGAIRPRYEKYDILRAEDPGTTLYLNFQGKSVGAFILAGPDAGIIEASVDGGPWQEYILYHSYSGGLNYTRSVIFAVDLSLGPHQLVLRVSDKKPDKSKGNAVSILYFEVNQ